MTALKESNTSVSSRKTATLSTDCLYSGRLVSLSYNLSEDAKIVHATAFYARRTVVDNSSPDCSLHSLSHHQQQKLVCSYAADQVLGNFDIIPVVEDLIFAEPINHNKAERRGGGSSVLYSSRHLRDFEVAVDNNPSPQVFQLNDKNFSESFECFRDTFRFSHPEVIARYDNLTFFKIRDVSPLPIKDINSSNCRNSGHALFGVGVAEP